jgi:hypothetical protein
MLLSKPFRSVFARLWQEGYSTVETALSLSIAGILACAGVSLMDFGSQDLTVVQQEFEASLHQAFHLARAQGKDVIVTLGDPKTPGIVPVRLPVNVKWGKPSFIPTPPGMDEPKRAPITGSAHPRITVTPRHTATACAWFVNDGKEAVCMRVSGHGHIQVLRWRRSTKKWSLC